MGLKDSYLKLKQHFAFLKWIDPFTYVELGLRRVHPRKEKPSVADEALDWIVYIVSAALFAFVLYNAIGLALGTTAPMVIVLSPSMEPLYYRGDVIVLQGVSPEDIIAPEIKVPFDSLKEVKMEEFASVIPKQFSPDGRPRTTTQLEINGKVIDLDEKGDIVVYFSPNSGREIIHRVVAKIKAGDGLYLLTKGDAESNLWVDQDCSEVSYLSTEGKKVYRMEGVCITSYPIKADLVKGRAVFKIPLIGYVKLLVFDDLRNLVFGCPYPEGCPFP